MGLLLLSLLAASSQRTLLVYAPDAGAPAVAQQREWLATQADGVRERDLVVVWSFADQPRRGDHRRELHVRPEEFRLVLVGKDGGVKWQRSTPAPLAEVFAVIDAMPMRRQEMRER